MTKRGLFFGATIAIFTMLLHLSGVAHASVNDFTITNFEADYYLSKDTDGRSALKTVEKITAQFPYSNQNHGIERAIPATYDGHSTSLNVKSVTDENGTPRNYKSMGQSNDNEVFRIGDADTYVHGSQTYIITYTQRDVTKFFQDTNDDEFYWDVNGLEWSQPVMALTARIHIPRDLVPALNDKMACYKGSAGSKVSCEITPVPEDDGVVYTATTFDLSGYQGATVAVGFAPHTFTEYQKTSQEKFLDILIVVVLIGLIAGTVVGIGLIIWLTTRRNKIMNRAVGRGTIIPEYLPPKDTSAAVASVITGDTYKAVTATLLDLAVRHYIKIYQVKEKSFFKAAQYELEIVKSPADLAEEERKLLAIFFGSETPEIGSRFEMKKLQKSYKYGTAVTKWQAANQKLARGTYGLYERAEPEAKWFYKVGTILLIISILTIAPLIFVAAITAYVYGATLWPLTQKGRDMKEYLEGLKEYISVAEEDRIKMLQSPEGAEKVGHTFASGESAELIKLYERVLPYAALFGIEKEWMERIGKFYESSQSNPDWYSGTGTFHAAAFASSISTFSTQSSSYTSPSSSSSGGSSGGGFSGGGGGGGGGGGW